MDTTSERVEHPATNAPAENTNSGTVTDVSLDHAEGEKHLGDPGKKP